jgi:dTDP-4-dehydrorhamnose reductase
LSLNEKIFPVNQYGYAKIEAEKTILNFNQEALVIRSNFFGRSKSKILVFLKALTLLC